MKISKLNQIKFIAIFVAVFSASTLSAGWETHKIVKYWAGKYISHRGVSEPMIVFQMEGVSSYRYVVLDGTDLSNQQAVIVMNAYNKVKSLSAFVTDNVAQGAWNEVSLVGVGDY